MYITYYHMVRKKLSITISDNLVEWVDLQVKKGNFSNKSQCIEHCVRYARDNAIKKAEIFIHTLPTDK